MMKRIGLSPLPALVIACVIACAALPIGVSRVRAQGMQRVAAAADTAAMRIARDTIFILDSAYIEIDLSRQELYRHVRNGAIDTFLCSTGDSRIPRGIATRPGIFAIAWKAAHYWSSRFDVPMLYWMPFNGGIGIHALEGDGYYKFLGYEASSHGCVRVSRETGESLFQNTPVGTVVFVHDGSPARVVSFVAPEWSDVEVMKRVDRKLLRARLNAITSGRIDHPSLRRRLALPLGKKPALGISVGRIEG